MSRTADLRVSDIVAGELGVVGAERFSSGTGSCTTPG